MNTHSLPLLHLILVAGVVCTLLYATPVSAETSTSADASVRTSATVEKPPVAPNIVDRLKALRIQNTGGDAPAKERPASTTMEKRPLVNLQGTTTMRAKLIDLASSTRAAIADRIQNIKERHDDMREKRAERLAEIQKKVSEQAYKSIRAIVERLGNAHEKLTDLLAKIADSLERGAADGKDVASAEAALALAETDLEAAGVAISAVETALGAAVDTDEPKQHMQKIRSAIEGATTAIKKAHQSTLEAMKQARIALAVSANVETSTESN